MRLQWIEWWKEKTEPHPQNSINRPTGPYSPLIAISNSHFTLRPDWLGVIPRRINAACIRNSVTPRDKSTRKEISLIGAHQFTNWKNLLDWFYIFRLVSTCLGKPQSPQVQPQEPMPWQGSLLTWPVEHGSEQKSCPLSETALDSSTSHEHLAQAHLAFVTTNLQ